MFQHELVDYTTQLPTIKFRPQTNMWKITLYKNDIYFT
jgi:hypothetical protein